MSLIQAANPMNVKDTEEAKRLATELWPEIDFETTTVVDLYYLSTVWVPIGPHAVGTEESVSFKYHGGYALAYSKMTDVLVIGYAEDVRRNVVTVGWQWSEGSCYRVGEQGAHKSQGC